MRNVLTKILILALLSLNAYAAPFGRESGGSGLPVTNSESSGPIVQENLATKQYQNAPLNPIFNQTVIPDADSLIQQQGVNNPSPEFNNPVVFYTGDPKIIDSGGRVTTFNDRYVDPRLNKDE